MRAKALFFIASLFLTTTALAADAPRVVVRTSLEPRSVTIGETAILKVDILTETFFLSAPELPALSIPGAVVTLSDERPEHLTEDIGGTTMFGVRRIYRFTPIVASNLAIPAFSVTAHPGPGEHRVTVATPARQLNVSAPEGAEDAFVTRGLTMDQKVDADLTKLKVGDSFLRTVEVTATGTPGMFIPDITFDAIDGLAAYPRTPIVSDAEPGQPAAGHRTFAVEYVVQRPGDYELPALEVKWWDLDAKQLQTATLPAIELHAVAAPLPKPEFEIPPENHTAPAHRPFDWRRALILAAGSIALFVLMYWLTPVVKRLAHRIDQQIAARRRRYLESEQHAFRQLNLTIRHGDVRKIPAALYRWLDRVSRHGHAGTEEAATTAINDSLMLGSEPLLSQCYSQRDDRTVDPLQSLHRSVRGARRELLARSTRARAQDLPPLNPA